MIFLFVIILILAVFSGYFLNKLSNKTGAILRENYLSVVYAREMSAGITGITSEVTTGFLADRNYDTLEVRKHIDLIDRSLADEKNNLTEPGEDNLVSGIETGYGIYKASVMKIIHSPGSPAALLELYNESGELHRQLLLLSQMNGKAIEVKTEDAKLSAKRALAQMTILATLCFLIGMSFTFSFASYFNQRIFQLHNGIKEIVASNFGQRLFFDGKDEFYEISLVFNEMAEKLKQNEHEMSVTLPDESAKVSSPDDVHELKKMLLRIRNIEEQTANLIAKLEKR